jgi:pilus assembly protein Flp/PilA
MFNKMIRAARRFWTDESGATMAEYALVVALIAAACIAAVTALGGAINTKFGTVTTALG